MTEKYYTVIDEEEPRGQSVAYNGIPCTARTCVTRLNRLTEENERLRNLISIADNLMYCITDNYRFETWNKFKKELLENE